MKMQKIMAAAVAAVVTLSFGAQVFAGTQTSTRDKKKDGTCIKKYDVLERDATQTRIRDQIKDGTCIRK